MNYIEIEDIDNFSTGLTTVEKTERINRIEETVERITGDFFYVKTFQKFLDGNGKKQIFPFLPSRIVSINKMVISDIEIDTKDFTSSNISGSSGEYTVVLTQSGITANSYQNDYIGIKDNSEAIDFYWGSRIISHTATVSGDVTYTLKDVLPMTLTSSDTVSVIYNWDFNESSIYRNPILTHHEPGTLMEPYEFFSYDIFPKGSRNIEIWGSIGYKVCPLNVKEACVILCRAENDSALYTSYGHGLKSEKLGDYSYTKFDSSQGGRKLTGVSEADIKLEMYIDQRPKIGAV